MQTLRTPDERFTDLPEFPYTPSYCEVPDDDGGSLRMAWVQVGPDDADPVLMLHGEPSWSFLYRKMIPALVAAGHRVVCPDLVGFGRSDKPTRIEDHTYARHVEWVRALAFDILDLHRVTLVGQDWGGLIGLRLAAEHPNASAGWSSPTPACPPETSRCRRSGGNSGK
ncbi:MAG: haloalkane dehalogenase [Mycobacterium sp.]|jgi:haloalkane dehalogenase|nr:haloalkane dehalogenase [Mycobacterium sp.]